MRSMVHPDAVTGNEDESGAATVWTACAIAALLVLLGALWTLGTVLVARQRAAGAADLSALAAAGHASEGEARACAHATVLAERMATHVSDCRLHGWDALVTVQLDVRGPVGLNGTITARARAGPVEHVSAPAESHSGR
ncbi:Rv3654c family TadE-like protein [Saccharomonospora xinjiangensis]|nr:hypothetical protein EYD13_19885 [Saccharomonospora xinjiangensis]